MPPREAINCKHTKNPQALFRNTKKNSTRLRFEPHMQHVFRLAMDRHHYSWLRIEFAVQPVDFPMRSSHRRELKMKTLFNPHPILSRRYTDNVTKRPPEGVVPGNTRSSSLDHRHRHRRRHHPHHRRHHPHHPHPHPHLHQALRLLNV